MVFVPGPAQPGVVHHFTRRLTAFEHTPDSSKPSENILIWIGGLSDGLLTVSYTTTLAKALPKDWSLAQVLLSSAYGGWGTASLQSDAKELATCVKYFRGIKTKVALMGHSTGCQDVMEYLVGPGYEQRPAIDGGILQAPISDREAMSFMMEPGLYESSVRVAQAMMASGKGEEMMPSSETKGFFGAPACARRWLSLASPNHDGEDDYFSSDLTDAQLMSTFGRLPPQTPVCILSSGSDQYVPKDVDKKVLVERWFASARAGAGRVNEKYSGVVEGATHNLRGDEDTVVEEVMSRVVGFLAALSSKSVL